MGWDDDDVDDDDVDDDDDDADDDDDEDDEHDPNETCLIPRRNFVTEWTSFINLIQV